MICPRAEIGLLPLPVAASPPSAAGVGKIHDQRAVRRPHRQIAFKRQLIAGGDHRVAADAQILGHDAGGGKRGAARQDAALDQAAQLAVELAVQIVAASAVEGDAVDGES